MATFAKQHETSSSLPRIPRGPRAAALSPGRRRSGFTLIETALATIIVGVGVLALVSAQQAFHQQNAWSTHASTAERLGNEIREMTLNLPKYDPVTGTAYWGPEPNELSWEDFDDVDDFDGVDGTGLSFAADWDENTDDNGPINARREIISNMEGWEQIVTVRNVDPFDINDGMDPGDGATDMVLVEVLVRYQGPLDPAPQDMTTVSWIAPK